MINDVKAMRLSLFLVTIFATLANLYLPKQAEAKTVESNSDSQHSEVKNATTEAVKVVKVATYDIKVERDWETNPDQTTSPVKPSSSFAPEFSSQIAPTEVKQSSLTTARVVVDTVKLKLNDGLKPESASTKLPEAQTQIKAIASNSGTQIKVEQIPITPIKNIVVQTTEPSTTNTFRSVDSLKQSSGQSEVAQTPIPADNSVPQSNSGTTSETLSQANPSTTEQQPTLEIPLQGNPSTTEQQPTPETPSEGNPPTTEQQPTPETPSEGNPPTTEQQPTPETPSEGNPPTTEQQPTPDSPQANPATPEARVLVSEVAITGVQGELQELIYNTIRTQPGRTATRSQLQADVNAIYETGYFALVNVSPEDTPLGVRVTFDVQPNPILRQVSVNTVPDTSKRVIPPEVVDKIFSQQYGQILNIRTLQESIKELNKWYKDNGYDLAQVIEAPPPGPDGNVVLTVAEGVVEDIQVRFLNKDKQTTDDQGNPVRGRTRPFIITRELAIKPGNVFNRNLAQQDLRRVYGLGNFEDVQLSFNPGTDPRQVVVVVDVVERNTGSLAAGAGISSSSGLFGTVSYQQQNLGGNNQKLGAEVQLGQRELLFDANFTDPWIAGDPYRTSYTVNGFRRRTLSLVFDNGDKDVDLAESDDRPRVLRFGGGVTFTRPLSKNPLEKSDWVASLGLQYQRVSIRNSDGDIEFIDEAGKRLSFSDSGVDDLLTLQLAAVRDLRNNSLRPTQGSLLRFGVEQSVPVGSGNIFLNRLRGSYSYYIPVNFTKFTKGQGAQTLAFNLQAGTVFGDLPPYEAFTMGGSNSVRGYEEGAVGSGRSYVQATAEYRFPIFPIIGGALFVDFGSDLGTGNSVPGDPAGTRGKPGSGLGYGIGVRVQSPLGPIRVDYGLNDQGDSRIHFGIGERF